MVGLLELLRGLGGGNTQGQAPQTGAQQPPPPRDGVLGMMAGNNGGGTPYGPQAATSPAPNRFSGLMPVLNDVFTGMAMGSDTNDAIGKAALMLNQGSKSRAAKGDQNKTVQWLQSRGLGAEEAAYLAGDPAALRAWYGDLKAGNEPDWQITKLFNNDGQEITAMVDKKSGKWNQIGGAESASSGGTEYGLTPQYGIDENGNPALIQLGKDGKAIKTPLPDGVTLSKEPIRMDAGTHFVLMDPVTRQVIGTVPKENREAAKDTALGTSEGKARGEAAASYSSMASKMPGLEAVIEKLDDLSEDATYTLGGQVYNAGRRQLGLSPTEGAKARTDYIATVDNQVLPLLRDTFGAAFTEREGDTLRKTLGDPDKSPQEKQIVLKSFIEQKRRDVEALARQSGQTPPQAPAPAPVAPPPSGGVPLDDLLKKYGG